MENVYQLIRLLPPNVSSIAKHWNLKFKDSRDDLLLDRIFLSLASVRDVAR